MIPTTWARITRPTFRRRLAIAFTLLALGPLLLFGAFAIARIDAEVEADADARVTSALGAAQAILADRQRALMETAISYATWPVMRDLIDRGENDHIERDTLAFQVDQGDIDAAVVETEVAVLSAGPGSVVQGITRAPRSADRSGGMLLALDGVYYQLASVAVSPAIPADPQDPGIVPVDATLTLVRRIDAGFAVDVRRLSGFDVAVLGADDAIAVASDPDAATTFRSRLEGVSGTDRDTGLVAGWAPIDAEGATPGRLLLTTRLETVRSLLGQLPTILLGLLGLAACLAVLGAWLLGRDLTHRLASIHGALTDMAVGRRPPARLATDDPFVERLEGALDDLVTATDRRDRVLRDLANVVAGMHARQGQEAIARKATEGARTTFGLRRCELVRADGSTVAGIDLPDDPVPLDGNEIGIRRVEVPVDTNDGAVHWLVGTVDAGQHWTTFDDFLIELYGRLVGQVLRDAQVHDATRGRIDQLGRRNELQREFLRSVSHNLRAPLTTISLLVEDLAEDRTDRDTGSTSEKAAAIRVETQRLERVVSQLLTVSRLDAGQLQLDSELVAIDMVASRVWAALGTDRSLTLEQRTPDLIGVGDRDAIEQILWILLDNALRYAPEGPIVVRTEQMEGTDPPRLLVEVIDAGPGVPESDRPFIFRRFWSGSAGRRHGGTGIGLDIARRLAGAMRASLMFRPGLPTGAVFALSLPAEAARTELPVRADNGPSPDWDYRPPTA